MTTKLSADLKREVAVGKELFTLTLTSAGFTLAPKGRRKGVSLTWADLVSGEAALAVALNASLKSLRTSATDPAVKSKTKRLPATKTKGRAKSSKT